MIIPYSTDAPIYYWPRATLGLILTNVAVHVAWSYSPPDSFEPFAMRLGDGLHPLQWLTHNFLHADFFHIFGNMIFLWAYGIIVEGKIGWFPFLLCYLGIGTAHGAAIQLAYAHIDGTEYVLGASGAIFGLMAICMIWAPVNDLSCFYLFFVGFRIITNTVELPIYVFALLQLALQVVFMLLALMIHGDPMSSELLHLSGAFWGLVAGIILLRAGWVDCEGWDVFSLIRWRRQLAKDWKAREARLDRAKEADRLPRSAIAEEDRPGKSAEEKAAILERRIREASASGDTSAGLGAFQKWCKLHDGRPPREPLRGLIKEVLDREEWALAVACLRSHCRLYPEHSDKLRLKLAMILVRHRERPAEALRVLKEIRPGSLEGTLEKARRQLIQESQRMVEDGVLELEEEV